MKAVLYSRVSSEEQVDNWSLSAQKREFAEFCQKKGWQAAGIYAEEGISAHSDAIEKRPQFMRILDGCKKHAFDVIVVHSLDRWSRNLLVTLNSFKQLADTGIAFASINENIDYSTPEGKLFIAMVGAFAQFYSDNLSKHTSKGLKERAVNGLPNGDLPFGYRRDEDGNVKIQPDEAEAVKQLFNMYAAGGYSLASLAVWLNSKGFQTRNKREFKDILGNTISGPRPFTRDSVRWLMHNHFFTGKVSYRGEYYAGSHEAIVEEGLFNTVQKKVKDAKSRCKTFSPSYRIYLLKGLARCIYCGYPLWSETSTKGYSFYREPKSANAQFKCPGNGKTISGSLIDSQMDSLINSLILEPKWKERIIEDISAESERDKVIEQRKQTETKLKRLARTYIDGLIADDDYKLQKKLLQDTLESLVIPAEDEAIIGGQLLENLKPIWGKATLEEKHRLLKVMLDAVYIDMASKRSIVGIQPKPTFYPLFKALENQADNKITVFWDKKGKKIEPPNKYDSSTVMVETGEG
jgi:site-specific DNA recombinase